MTPGKWLLQLTAVDITLLIVLFGLSVFVVHRMLVSFRNYVHNKYTFSDIEVPGPLVHAFLAAFLTALAYIITDPLVHKYLID